MNAIPDTTWQDELGLDRRPSTGFFASRTELESQDTLETATHIVRRAFDDLELNAVLCDQNSPLIYFKFIQQPTPQQISRLHRRFWNHGGAPILVIVTSHEVQILSSLVEPIIHDDAINDYPGLVTKIDRVSLGIREFLPSVESGEFFHTYAQWFNPKSKVDQILLDQLQATREKLSSIDSGSATNEDLDALLCRLVFTCYLFDRKIIGTQYLKDLDIPQAAHLRDVLLMNSAVDPKAALYRLFGKLTQDFNGDLFNDDLDAEKDRLSDDHLFVVEAFFNGTNVITGQQAFWPYDFGLIPIETVSAIYERFLKPSDKAIGSFYTPRFLAELVLDIALKGRSTLTGLRFLDPACGSGIFLVGLFNQLAEEWGRSNPNARNDTRATALVKLLQTSIFGVDINPTACRITAFSLYLAYLDQLSPRDIQKLQKRGRVLPRLVARLGKQGDLTTGSNIWCGDFFQEDTPYSREFDVVIGNPPWGSIADNATPAGLWCATRQLEIPDKQIAAAFMWKATQHVSIDGSICFVLPHGTLFNHNKTALDFQKRFIEQHALDLVLNLTDYQSFLFSEARHPALVIKYGKQKSDKERQVEYWTPKADWKVTRAEVVTISEQDRTILTVQSILSDLQKEDAPQIWKRLAWATPRDQRLLDRLSDLPRLRASVKQAGEKDSAKPWFIAEGFQPFGGNDSPSTQRNVELPTTRFIPADSKQLNLFLLPQDCQSLDSRHIITRRGIRDTRIFNAPHVLVTKGFSGIAFADFPVTFRHALRGIVGAQADRKQLIFLAAYMRSPLAQYFLFHTSSNWGVSRNEVHVKELLRLPFPIAASSSKRSEQIVEEVAQYVLSAADKARDEWVDRRGLVAYTQAQINPLIYEYFDVLPSERILVEDTVRLTIPSFRPGSKKRSIPAIAPASLDELARYVTRICDTLNSWATGSESRVIGTSVSSQRMGIGLAVLERTNDRIRAVELGNMNDLLVALKYLQESTATKTNTFELLRGAKIFDHNRLYIAKPLGKRYWSETAALNDADEIAAAILMQSPEGIK